MTKNKVNPGKGYRLLKKGEFTNRGDEVWAAGLGPWVKRSDPEEVLAHMHAPVRRKIHKEGESPKGWNVTIHCKTRASARYLKACIVNHKVKITKAND